MGMSGSGFRSASAPYLTEMRRLFLIASICAVMAPYARANAAPGASEAPPMTAAEADSIVRRLEEVDVVGLKYDLAHRAMPVAGDRVGREQAERLRINDSKGLSGVVPNFYIPDYGSRITSSIYVRGIGARMDQPAVGLTIDNVGILNKDAYDLDITDISGLEMMRGPQSTLFGRNTMTGMISIRTLSPMEFQGWRALAELGLDNLFKFNIGWYRKFRRNLGFSLTGSFYRYVGQFINQYDKRKTDIEVNGSFRNKVHWIISPDVTLVNTLSGSLLRQGGYPYESVASGQINYNDTCFYRRGLLTDGLTVNARLPHGLKLTSVSSFQFLNDNMTLDQDFLPDPYFTITQKKTEYSVTQDLMLRGSVGENRYTWLTGVYGFYRHLDMTAPVTFKEYGISHLIETNRNKVNPHYPIRWDEDSFPLNSDFTMPSGGAAVYHESRLRAGRWQLAAALRLDYEHITMSYRSFCNTSYTIYDNPSGVMPIPADATPYRNVKVDIDDTGRLTNHYLQLLPKISVLYELEGLEASNLYASIGKGYKAGGFNTQMFSDVLQQRLMRFMGLAGNYDVSDIVEYRPEKTWNYEAGAHLSFPAAMLTADFSLFYIDCRDQQMTVFPDGNTTGRLMTNAGRTRSFGGEMSVRWNPTSTLRFTVNYGYTNSRFVRFNDGREDYRGKRLPYVPSNTLFMEGAYDLHLTGKNRNNYFSFSLNLNGTGNIYWNEANSLRQDFYGLLGLNISYFTPRWSLELWGKNITGTDYYTFYFLSIGNEFLQRGRKMQLGATVRAFF